MMLMIKPIKFENFPNCCPCGLGHGPRNHPSHPHLPDNTGLAQVLTGILTSESNVLGKFGFWSEVVPGSLGLPGPKPVIFT